MAWLLPLLVLTLTPVPRVRPVGDPMSTYCLICGGRGTADAVLNVVVFMPLGLLLARLPRAVLVAGVAGTALACGIEVVQLVVPGRYATLGDIVWNGAGAALGAAAFLALARRPDRRGPPRWASPVYALAVGVGLAVAGRVLEHQPGDGPYFGQWTADLGSMPQYQGTLLDATLDGSAIPNTRFPASARARERFAGDWALNARVIKGPAPPAVSPIVSVYNTLPEEIFLFGAHGEDLVLRERTLGSALRLDLPDLRVVGALSSVAVGDTLTIGARRVGHDRCISVDTVERCGLGFTPGRTWSLLLYMDGAPERARRALDLAWSMLLLLPVGALATSRRARARDAAVIVALIAAAVASTRLLAPPPREIAAAALGLLVGWGLRRFFVARAATTRPDSARHRFEGAVDALEAKRAE